MRINTLFKHWTYRFFAPGLVLRTTYDAFRELLVFDSRSHELMADLEDLYYQGKKEDCCRIAARYDALSTNVRGMVERLEQMAPGSFVTLPEYFRKFDFYSRFLLAPPTLHFGPPFVLGLSDPAVNPALTGGKSATLAIMAKTLQLPVPAGFIITVNSFQYLLEYNDLRSRINDLLAQIDLTSPDSLASISHQLTDLIQQAEVPADIAAEILAAHARLQADQGDDIRVAVRSSAVSEDGECSFAGQYQTVLEVQQEQLIAAYLNVLASKYTPQALAYRIHSGLSDDETPMAVMVLEMIKAVASGVVYTIDPALLDTTHLFIHAVAGQGEALVSGQVIPQILTVDRHNTLRHRLEDEGSGARPSLLTEEQITALADQALQIESHFGRAQDIEWALTKSGPMMFLQSRPLHSHPSKARNNTSEISQLKAEPLLAGGTMAALGQACGPAYCVDASHPVEQVPAGAILVVRESLPSYVQVLDRINGVLAELGSVAGHFSTVCREFGIPLLCGLGRLIEVIPHGQLITMSAEGRVVYQGDLLTSLITVPLHESQQQLPFFQKLRKLLANITPLHLIDPTAKGFTPESCRSLHDIIRFCHEQAVRTMFSLGDRLSNKSSNRKKLLAKLPFDIFMVDVGGGLSASANQQQTIELEQVRSIPFLALWTGLNHPSVQWPERAHFDWKHFGEMAMADGIASTDSPDFASYAVLGGDYVHLIMRFGYHFTLVDCICGEDSASNYCQFRFAGGGADFSGRLLRLDFIAILLRQAGFQVEMRGDLLDARIAGLSLAAMQRQLVTLGRLLGTTKLMDMSLHDKQEVQQYVQDFLADTRE